MTTSAELDKEVFEASGFEAEDIVDLPGLVQSISWPGIPRWECGAPIHDNPNLQIYRMFGSGTSEERVEHIEYVIGDVRVYAYPKQSLPGESFKRITLNRATPVSISENLSHDAFVAEVARELEELSSLDASADKEDCPNEDCDNMVAQDDSYCSNCGTKLEHAEGEGPEEPEDAAPESGPQPAPEVVS
jgi:hypothetical protein